MERRLASVETRFTAACDDLRRELDRPHAEMNEFDILSNLAEFKRAGRDMFTYHHRTEEEINGETREWYATHVTKLSSGQVRDTLSQAVVDVLHGLEFSVTEFTLTPLKMKELVSKYVKINRMMECWFKHMRTEKLF